MQTEYMTADFTPELLLQYIYSETSEQQDVVIESALEGDENLRQTYAELLDGIAILDKIPLLGMDIQRMEYCLQRMNTRCPVHSN
jgi:Ni2+-binding GTPase involved in maturation of urease and hydrogenase